MSSWKNICNHLLIFSLQTSDCLNKAVGYLIQHRLVTFCFVCTIFDWYARLVVFLIRIKGKIMVYHCKECIECISQQPKLFSICACAVLEYYKIKEPEQTKDWIILPGVVCEILVQNLNFRTYVLASKTILNSFFWAEIQDLKIYEHYKEWAP